MLKRKISLCQEFDSLPSSLTFKLNNHLSRYLSHHTQLVVRLTIQNNSGHLKLNTLLLDRGEL